MKRVTKAVFVSGRSLRELNLLRKLACDEHGLEPTSIPQLLWNGVHL